MDEFNAVWERAREPAVQGRDRRSGRLGHPRPLARPVSLHPAVAAVRLGVRRALADVEPGRTVVVACSGGADSLALLAATVFEGRKAGWHVVGATVDHGLQDGLRGAGRPGRRPDGRRSASTRPSPRASRSRAPGSAPRPPRGRRGTPCSRRSPSASTPPPCCSATPATTRPRRCCSAWPAARAAARSPGCARLRPRSSGPLLDVSRDRHRHRLPGRGHRVLGRPAQRRPRLHPGPGPAHRAPDARGPARPRRRRHAGPHRRPAARRHGPARRRRRGGVRRPRRDLPVDGLLAQPAPIRRRVLRLAALDAGAPPAELFHEHVLAMDALLTDWHGQKWVDLPGSLRGASASRSSVPRPRHLTNPRNRPRVSRLGSQT